MVVDEVVLRYRADDSEADAADKRQISRVTRALEADGKLSDSRKNLTLQTGLYADASAKLERELMQVGDKSVYAATKAEILNGSYKTLNATQQTMLLGMARQIDLAQKSANAHEQLRSRIDRLPESFKRAGEMMTIGLTVPILALGDEAIKTAAKFGTLDNALTLAMGSAAAAEGEISKLKETAKNPGIDFESAVRASINLQRAGNSAEFSRRTIAAFGNALASVGKTGPGALDGVISALSGIEARTKVTSRGLIQLEETMPQIKKAIADAFGTSDPIALEKRGMSGQQLVGGIVNELEKVGKMPDDMTNQLKNLKDTWDEFLISTGKALMPLAQEWLPKLATGIAHLADEIDRLTPRQKQLLIDGVAAGAISGPLLAAAGNVAQLGSNTVNTIRVLKDLKGGGDSAGALGKKIADVGLKLDNLATGGGLAKKAVDGLKVGGGAEAIADIGVAATGAAEGVGILAAAIASLPVLVVAAATATAAVLNKKWSDEASETDRDPTYSARGINRETLSQADSRRLNASDGLSDTQRAQASAVESLIKKYRELNDTLPESKDKHEQLQGILDRISQAMPSVISAWDSYGHAVGLVTDALSKAQQAENDYQRQQKLTALENALGAQSAEGAAKDALRNQIDLVGSYGAKYAGLSDSDKQILENAREGLKDRGFFKQNPDLLGGSGSPALSAQAILNKFGGFNASDAAAKMFARSLPGMMAEQGMMPPAWARLNGPSDTDSPQTKAVLGTLNGQLAQLGTTATTSAGAINQHTATWSALMDQIHAAAGAKGDPLHESMAQFAGMSLADLRKAEAAMSPSDRKAIDKAWSDYQDSIHKGSKVVSEAWREIAKMGGPGGLGFVVTSTTGGKHEGLGHREGRATDFSESGKSQAEINNFVARFRAMGYTVLNEDRAWQAKHQDPAWTGPNVHVEAPRGMKFDAATGQLVKEFRTPSEIQADKDAKTSKDELIKENKNVRDLTDQNVNKATELKMVQKELGVTTKDVADATAMASLRYRLYQGDLSEVSDAEKKKALASLENLQATQKETDALVAHVTAMKNYKIELLKAQGAPETEIRAQTDFGKPFKNLSPAHQKMIQEEADAARRPQDVLSEKADRKKDSQDFTTKVGELRSKTDEYKTSLLSLKGVETTHRAEAEKMVATLEKTALAAKLGGLAWAAYKISILGVLNAAKALDDQESKNAQKLKDEDTMKGVQRPDSFSTPAQQQNKAYWDRFEQLIDDFNGDIDMAYTWLQGEISKQKGYQVQFLDSQRDDKDLQRRDPRAAALKRYRDGGLSPEQAQDQVNKDAQSELNDLLDKQADALNKATMGWKEYERWRLKSTTDLSDGQINQVIAGEEQVKKAEELAKVGAEVKTQWEGAWEAVVNGSKSAGDALKDFIHNVDQMLTKRIADQFADATFGPLMGGVFGGKQKSKDSAMPDIAMSFAAASNGGSSANADQATQIGDMLGGLLGAGAGFGPNPGGNPGFSTGGMSLPAGTFYPGGPSIGGSAGGSALMGGLAGAAFGAALSTMLPGRANGGPIGDGAYVVGERGPEVLVNRGAKFVIPNHQIGVGGASTKETHFHLKQQFVSSNPATSKYQRDNAGTAAAGALRAFQRAQNLA